jgi:hypothetical protein
MSSQNHNDKAEPGGINIGSLHAQGPISMSVYGNASIHTTTGEMRQLQQTRVELLGMPVTPEQRVGVFKQVDQIEAEIEADKDRLDAGEKLEMARKAVEILRKQLKGKPKQINSKRLANVMKYLYRCGGGIAGALLLFFKDPLANRIFENIGGPALNVFRHLVYAGGAV